MSELSQSVTEPEWRVGHFHLEFNFLKQIHELQPDLSEHCVKTDRVWVDRSRTLLSWTCMEWWVLELVWKKRNRKITDILWRQNRKIKLETERKGGIRDNSSYSVRYLGGGWWCHLLRWETLKEEWLEGKQSGHVTWGPPVGCAGEKG